MALRQGRSYRRISRINDTGPPSYRGPNMYNYSPTTMASMSKKGPRREHESQVAEIANGVYGADAVTANYVQFWFRRFRSGIFDVKDSPRTSRLVVENVDKVTEVIEVDRHVSSRSIAQELKINHKTVLRQWRKVGFKKKLHVWVPHQLTPKNMMDLISISEAFSIHFLSGW
ncbi:histone-lysine N-methyltransferase SETMAR [Trichonephila clavipes]|nr:histone-lysine N-methyltransferase SETMAR [Trichonephila clavipes]